MYCIVSPARPARRKSHGRDYVNRRLVPTVSRTLTGTASNVTRAVATIFRYVFGFTGTISFRRILPLMITSCAPLLLKKRLESLYPEYASRSSPSSARSPDSACRVVRLIMLCGIKSVEIFPTVIKFGTSMHRRLLHIAKYKRTSTSRTWSTTAIPSLGRRRAR